MKITKAKLVYAILTNIPINFIVCVFSSIYKTNEINWNVIGINFIIGYIIAVFVVLFFPLKEVGIWFTKLLKIDPHNYNYNVKFRLASLFIITLIKFVIVSIFLTIFNYFLLQNHDILQAVIMRLKTFISLFIIAYLVTIFADHLVRFLVNKIDEDF